MTFYRIRVGKNYFDDPHYITTVKYRHDDLVEVNIASTSISKTFHQFKRIKNIEKLFKKLEHYCYIKNGNIDFYEIEKVEV